MKTSEVLKQGLLFYRPRSFMCNVVSEMGSQIGSEVTPSIVVQVEQAIHSRLDNWFTLDSYLKNIDPAYLKIRNETDRWSDESLHTIRVAFWNAFIVELEARGE